MWVFTLFIPALQVFQGGSMKVFLVSWHMYDGPSNENEGVVGIYRGGQNAITATRDFLVGKEDFEYYSFNIEEMEVND